MYATNHISCCFLFRKYITANTSAPVQDSTVTITPLVAPIMTLGDTGISDHWKRRIANVRQNTSIPNAHASMELHIPLLNEFIR